MANPVNDSTFDKLGLAPKQEATTARNDRLGQEQFLELMIAQLRNQDPLKPMENGEFLGQMAQFGTVSGIQDLQNSINQLSAALQSGQALQASALVGRSVLVPGNSGRLESAGASLSGVVDVPAGATAITLSIRDSAGQLVRSLELGPQAAGSAQFKWDGITDGGQPAAAGHYTVTAEATVEGKPVALDISLATRVESVSLGQGGAGITLNLEGQGSIPLSEVREIL